ncbi:MAG TPA: pyrroline-5-carboxylate reductase dimerization domain-containing protein [Candidatus Sulfotelmatobacter sp.]|jgi:pyrroline-5-carboxylate reductase
MKTTTVFLGGGRITSALIAGLRLGGDDRLILVFDRNPEKLRALRRAGQVETSHKLTSELFRDTEMLIVAVRPRSVEHLLDSIEKKIEASGLPVPRLCVSLAAGVPLHKLRGRLGPKARWARAMPSPVCRVGRGLTALSFDRSVSQRDRKKVRDFFARVGAILEIPEKQLDVFTATFSSSHGYHALSTLAEAAHAAGLDAVTAQIAAAHALCDGIAYWRESGESLSDLLQEAATPGGTAAATVAAMDSSGYARAIRNGIRAGMQQARRNARR